MSRRALPTPAPLVRSRRLAALCDELWRRTGRGMLLGLDRMKKALSSLGHPEERCPFVHIAGTNGKGSTSAMVASIAQAAGLRTGLFTSPHLCRFTERIQVNGEAVSDDVLEEALARAFEASPEATFFEALTLAAFIAFDRSGIELGVLEVGIGGKLDATNVLDAPLCTAVTSIGFDHTAMLGDTLAEIARQKAGIFRPSVPVVLGPLEPEALAATLEVAAALGAGPIWRVGDDAGADTIQARRAGEALTIALPDGRTIATRLSLAGAHQTRNAAVVAGIAARAAARFPAMADAIGAGIAATRWPGRLERIPHGDVTVLLDCAHNPHGVATLVEHLRAEAIDPARVVLIFGALGDKAWTTMLDQLAPCAHRRIYASPKGRAPASLDEMAARWPGEAIPEGPAALARALGEVAREGDVIVVAGSIYLVGELRGALLGIACDPVIAL
jgi:dihydrofolate synthase / folylpolyglutamate synthase